MILLAAEKIIFKMFSSNVQKKINCVFKTTIKNGTSDKRPGQNYNVIATEVLQEEAQHASFSKSSVSEKVDGTCCFIQTFEGKLL